MKINYGQILRWSLFLHLISQILSMHAKLEIFKEIFFNRMAFLVIPRSAYYKFDEMPCHRHARINFLK